MTFHELIRFLFDFCAFLALILLVPGSDVYAGRYLYSSVFQILRDNLRIGWHVFIMRVFVEPLSTLLSEPTGIYHSFEQNTRAIL